MGAAPGTQVSSRRYRRRIVGWGAAALLLVLGIGSAVTLARVEDDLEQRVAGALEGASIEGVTVSFSGQDGTLECATPLEDAGAAQGIALDERGVRSVDLDASCTGSAGSGSAGSGSATPVSEPPATATTAPTATDVPASTSTTTTLPDATTVLDILLDDPQFSVLKNALQTVGLEELVGGDGPITIFAPTDDAFAALGPNFNAALASDADALTNVLRHHIVEADLPSDVLADGPLTMTDGSAIEVDTSVGVRLVSGDVVATVIDADLDAVNGTVHVVDQVLLPAGVAPGGVAEVFIVVARYEDGRLELSGTVVDEAQRQQLLDAAATGLAAGNVVDRLTIDPEMPLSDADAGALATLAAGLAPNLVVGEVVVTADGVFVSGVYVDEAARDAIDALAAGVGAVTGLTERATATAAGAAELEERLNGVVVTDPIRFEVGSSVLAADAALVLDRVASIAKSLGGVVVTVEGHTDSDGDPARNLELSLQRAEAVRLAMIARGVPEADVVAVGFGSERPVLVDGVEDKAASRRVEFVVERD